MSDIHRLIAGTYDMLEVPSLTDAHETLCEAFLKMRSSCIHLRRFVEVDLIDFFRYQKYELGALGELISEWTSKQSEVNKLEKRLRERKEQLFAQKLVPKWELNPTCTIPVDTLLNDKVVAFREMLPNDTQEAHNQRINYGYYSNKVLEEFLRLNKKDEKDVKQHFYDVARRNCEIFEEINVMWADMVAHFAQIKDKVDTSDEKIVKAHERLPPNIFEKKERLAALQKKAGH